MQRQERELVQRQEGELEELREGELAQSRDRSKSIFSPSPYQARKKLQKLTKKVPQPLLLDSLSSEEESECGEIVAPAKVVEEISVTENTEVAEDINMDDWEDWE